jgi:transglutaminase-like putative cysteine protease
MRGWARGWGRQHGWIGLDPTNDVVVQDEHVVLGWGRDYGDVSPVRGVLLGGGSHKLSVSVDLEAV